MKVLIANFDFPPNQGIGGRRWAKFAKGLASRGINVYVIKADPVRDNIESPWNADVLSPLIHIRSLPRTYPESVSHPKPGVLAKLRYIADMRGLKKYNKGTIYDLALNWEEEFCEAAVRIIRNESITHVIATGAPFNLLYYTSKLRDVFPHIRILADYRDPWLTARNYGMQNLSAEMFGEERRKQQLVFDLADVITTPYPQLLKTLMHEDVRLEEHIEKFHLLPHLFDEDDVPVDGRRGQQDKIVLVYAGALYMDIQKPLQLLAKAIELHASLSKRQILVKIFTDSELPESPLFHLPNVLVSRGVGKAVFSEIRNADLCLLFMAEHNCNFLTTKIMEYLPLRCPFLYLGPKGEVSNFIAEHGLGYCPDDIVKEWPELVRMVEDGHPGFNIHYDVGQHNLRAATQRLLELLS